MTGLSDVDAARRIAPSVAEHLNRGGLIAYPTETLYGLGGLPDERGVRQLRTLKGRSRQQPFLILVSGIPMLRDLGLELNASARALAGAFWPGPLTLIIDAGGAGQRLPQDVVSKSGGVAVRLSGHPPLNAMIEALGTPITSTSANRTTSPPPQSVADVRREFDAELRDGLLMLLEGKCTAGIPSTIVDSRKEPVEVMRRGVISEDDVLTVASRPT